MTDDQPVRVGVVGLGGRGRAHAEDAEALGHEVVAGADVTPEAREAFAADFGVPAYESHGELIESEALDAIEIATPNRYHEAAAVAGFGAGLDVFVEKPLAHDLASAERIAAAARDADGFGMVGFNYRFRDAGAILESHVRDGRLGDVRHVEANKIRRRGIPTPGSWFTDRETSGGGALLDIGGHVLHYALALLDFPETVTVSGTTRSAFSDLDAYVDPNDMSGKWTGDEGTFDVDDSATAFLRCDDGRTVALDVAWATNRPANEAIEVAGTDAGAVIDAPELTLLETDARVSDHFCDAEIVSENDDWRAIESAFLDAVASGGPPDRNTVAEGLAVQRVLDAVYRSDETGEQVRVDL